MSLPRPAPRNRLRLRPAGLVVLVLLNLLGALTFLFLPTTAAPDLGRQAGPRPPADRPAVPDAAAPGGPVSALRATTLDIPKLGIRQDLLELGVDQAGVLQPPAAPDVAGWFTGAAAPGERGPTVIAGHVDSRAGPGVFHALSELSRGDLVSVGRSDGRTAVYRVTEVLTVDKDRFPTQRVYGPTAGAELRLITCGGPFDRASGHYLRNVVVSGILVEPS